MFTHLQVLAEKVWGNFIINTHLRYKILGRIGKKRNLNVIRLSVDNGQDLGINVPAYAKLGDLQQ